MKSVFFFFSGDPQSFMRCMMMFRMLSPRPSQMCFMREIMNWTTTWRWPHNVNTVEWLALICDVISENVPYCRTNGVILDQLFLHFCDSIFIKHGIESDKNVFFRCLCKTDSVGPDQTPRFMRGIWTGPTIFVPQ